MVTELLRASLTPRIRKALESRLLAQAGFFAVSSGVVSLLAAGGKAIVAGNLSTAAFGSFSFATSFLLFTAMFFEFGVFLPAARLLVRVRGRAKREVVGAAFVLFVPVGVGFVVATLGFAAAVDHLFHVQCGQALAVTAPLAAVYPFRQLALWLAQGLGQLHLYSVTNVASQGLFIAALVGANAIGSLTLTGALALQGGAYTAGAGLFVLWTRPVFTSLGHHVGALLKAGRAYGFHVYVGRILSIGTYNMDVLMLGFFTTAPEVGFYSLAGAIAAASGLPVIGLSTALFPRMVGRGDIKRRWLVAASGVGLAAAVSAAVLAAPFIDVVFSERYHPAVSLVAPLALAQAVRGVTSIYNSFLAAQARGRELRNAGFVLTLSNIILNFGLIPPFGATGAAWASLLALVANLAAHVIYYRRSLVDRRPEVTEPETALAKR